MVTRKLLAVTSPPTITLVDLLPTLGCAGKGIVRGSPHQPSFARSRAVVVYTRESCVLVTTLLRQAACASGQSRGESRDAQKRKLAMYGEEKVCRDDVGTSEGWHCGTLCFRSIDQPGCSLCMARIMARITTRTQLASTNECHFCLDIKAEVHASGTTVHYMWQRSTHAGNHESDHAIIPPSHVGYWMLEAGRTSASWAFCPGTTCFACGGIADHRTTEKVWRLTSPQPSRLQLSLHS
jgi:hypothetical protein